MDEMWFVACLWILVGLAGTLLATWVGRSLGDEFLNARRRRVGQQKSFQLIRGGRTTAAEPTPLRTKGAVRRAVLGGRAMDQSTHI